MKKLTIFILAYFYYFESKAQVWQQLTNGVDDNVYSICYYNGELIAGGKFLNANGVPCNRIAKWDGTTWSVLSTGMNNEVLALCVYAGELYAGGKFTTAGGISCNRVAKWNGVSWLPVGLGMDDQVNSLYVLNGNLYAGGEFILADGLVCNRIAKWDGFSWSPISIGANGGVSSVNSYNGDLIIAGYFNSAYNISQCNGIAGWNGTSGYTLANGVNAGLFQIKTLSNNNSFLYMGGNFNTVGGNTVEQIGKWDGTNWSNMCIGGTNGTVETLLSYNNNLYAGGSYSFFNGLPASFINIWDGASWSTLAGGLNSIVNVLYEHDDTLYVGGEFTASLGNPLNHIAYLEINSPLPIELAKFDVRCDFHNECVELNWQTYSEHENYGFYIERSVDGINFKTVEWVPAGSGGYSNIILNYDYCDYDFPEGLCYYRLRQMDYNGESSPTKTLSVHCVRNKKNNTETSQVISIITHDLVNLQLISNYKIYDLAGKKIGEGNSKQISFGKFTNGMYLLQIQNGGIYTQMRVIKN